MKKKATIIYKSGVKVHVKVDELTVKWSTSAPDTVTSMEWTAMEPAVLHAGISQIESVWDGWV